MTHTDWYKEQLTKMIGWSGLSKTEMEKALRASKGKYAKEVLKSLTDL